MRLLTAALAVLLLGMLPSSAPAQLELGVEHHLYWYPTAQPVDLACGASTTASKVYDDIYVVGGLGAASTPLKTTVIRPGGSLAWEQENQAAVRFSLGRVKVATIGQPLFVAGGWRFDTDVGPAFESCEITKV